MRTRHLSLAALALLAACGGGDAPAKGGAGQQRAGNEPDVPEAQRYGGTLVMGAIGAIPDMNPLTSSDNTANQVQQFVLFMPLITYNEKFEPIPWLARSWEVNADTSALTFHLRNDVYWHDGPRTTAYDVKYSYDMARDPKTLFPNTAFWTHYGDATVVDSFTIRIAMQPHADFMDPWRSFSPVPRHILEGTEPSAMTTHPFNTRSPVGNGPFRFVEHLQGQRWVFEANPNFPKELGGRPYVDRLVYRIIPEPTTLMAELLRGNLDYYIATTAEQAAEVEASPEARIISFPDRQFSMIGWNEKRDMFKDVRVRRALTMALDREAIVRAVRRGYGQLGNSTIPPFFWNHDAQAGADLKFDTVGAKRLLAEAGWQDRNGDGILENAQGRPFTFTMITNQGNREREDIAVIVQSQLRRVGIDARTQLMEWGSLLDRIQDVDKRDYDAVIIAWVTEFRIDDTDLFSCDKLRDPYQWVSYCNPQTDRFLDTLPRLVDRATSLPVWREYQRHIASQQPYTILYFTRRLEGVHERLRNVNPDARGDMLDIRKWYLLPNMRSNNR